MFVFRDESMLKRIQINKTIEQHAQQQLFVNVEYILRKVIQEARKYQIHFRQKQLTSQFVDMAIKDLNYDKCDVLGFQYMDTINLTKTQSEHILNDQNQDLKDLISYQFRTLRIPIGHPQIIFFNVLHNQQMINSPETQQLLQQREIMNLDIKQQQEEKKSFNIVRDNIISILSPHQQDILKSFQQTFKQEIISLQLSCQPQFVQLQQDLQIFKDVSSLLPFITQYLYQHQEGQQLYQYKKRRAIIYCLTSIIQNPHINLEHQLHVFIKILSNFLISFIEDINIVSIQQIQNQAAYSLKLIIDKYSIKYPMLKINLNSLLANKLDQLQNQDIQSLVKAYSIIQYYIFQSIEPVHQQIIQSIANILKQIYENQNMINGHAIKQRDDDQLYHIQYQIELQLNQMLIKIMDGLKYLLPDNQQQFWVIIQNCVELLRALGREETKILYYDFFFCVYQQKY
ncbi:hypothetical protein pb186bvf_006213 [Paramecium bursaria]